MNQTPQQVSQPLQITAQSHASAQGIAHQKEVCTEVTNLNRQNASCYNLTLFLLKTIPIQFVPQTPIQCAEHRDLFCPKQAKSSSSIVAEYDFNLDSDEGFGRWDPPFKSVTKEFVPVSPQHIAIEPPFDISSLSSPINLTDNKVPLGTSHNNQNKMSVYASRPTENSSNLPIPNEVEQRGEDNQEMEFSQVNRPTGERKEISFDFRSVITPYGK